LDAKVVKRDLGADELVLSQSPFPHPKVNQLLLVFGVHEVFLGVGAVRHGEVGLSAWVFAAAAFNAFKGAPGRALGGRHLQSSLLDLGLQRRNLGRLLRLVIQVIESLVAFLKLLVFLGRTQELVGLA